MRLLDLAYCCRLYAEGTGYDVALARFLRGTSGAVDLRGREHRDLTLQWLRDLGLSWSSAWGQRGFEPSATAVVGGLGRDLAGES